MWCRWLGPGAECPRCGEAISITDLLSADQLAPTVPATTKRRR